MAKEEPGIIELRGELASSATALASADINALVNKSMLGESFSFETARANLLILIRYAQIAQALNYNVLPEHVLKQVSKALATMTRSFTECRRFDTMQGDAVGRHADVVTAITSAVQSIPALLQTAEFLSEKLGDQERDVDEELAYLKEQYANLIDEGRQRLAEREKEFAERSEESKAFLEKQKQTTSESAVVSHSDLFDWFSAPVTSNSADVIAYAVQRALQLLVPVAGLVFSSKQFAAERHNSVVNKHRATALRTYEALLAGVESLEIRDQIMSAAATAIFGSQSTGFLKSSIDVNQLPVGSLIGKG